MRRELITALQNPELWKISEYRLEHKASGEDFWIGGGWLFFNNDAKCLTLIDKLVIWPHVRRLKRLWMMNRLSLLKKTLTSS